MLCEEGAEAADVSLNELGVERDGGEGVLDLVGDAAGYFFPGTLFLGAQQFGGVFEDEDIAAMFTAGALEGEGTWAVGGAAFEQGDCGCEVKDAGAGLHLHLGGSGSHAVCAAEEMVERIDDVFGEHCGEREADELALAAGVEHLGEGSVGEQDAAIGGERDDAGGNGLDDRFEFGAAGLEGVVEV